ncbi:DUF3891 family protein [Halalkalibacillus halophilus]|uniref:DUF3891 family protein n=1 Tax=Halalkalibacillus halophilus TaxID=392827 RepID=UPI00042913EB|nr:DUF3891 family protein [Halalkalibacillus halophilus]
MIVTDGGDHFKLIEQHEHAQISGVIADYWPKQLFKGIDLRDDVIYAAYNHDCGWKALDANPEWNGEKDAPYSFMTYPNEIKVKYYEAGIDEVQKESDYAALLCSMHYQSFFKNPTENDMVFGFISREIKRQNDIKARLEGQIQSDIVEFHFKLLQFCDDLSLYFCLNHPGTAKSNEIGMFQDGFRQIFDGIDEKIIANWVSDQAIEIKPFPFELSFPVTVSMKEIDKSVIDQMGIHDAYYQTDYSKRTATFR